MTSAWGADRLAHASRLVDRQFVGRHAGWYVPLMGKGLQLAQRALAKLFALACGIVFGAALAVAIMGDGPAAWIRSLHLFRPPASVESMSDVILEIEWEFALIYGCVIVVVAGLPWMLLIRFRGEGYWPAAILGCVLAASAGFFVLSSDTELSRSAHVLLVCLFGCAGAAAGTLTFALDGALQGRLRRR